MGDAASMDGDASAVALGEDAARALVAEVKSGGCVDAADVGLLLVAWNAPGGDINADGNSDAADLGRLVADDVVQVAVRPPDTIWGAATDLHQHHMEIRGMGILNITHLFGVGAVRDTKKVEVVVELSDLHEDDYDRLGTESTAPRAARRCPAPPPPNLL